jgi:hypothetical protein
MKLMDFEIFQLPVLGVFWMHFHVSFQVSISKHFLLQRSLEIFALPILSAFWMRVHLSFSISKLFSLAALPN